MAMRIAMILDLVITIMTRLLIMMNDIISSLTIDTITITITTTMTRMMTATNRIATASIIMMMSDSLYVCTTAKEFAHMDLIMQSADENR